MINPQRDVSNLRRHWTTRGFPTLLVVSILGGCGSPLQLYVIINDPCDGQSAIDASKHIMVDVYDVPEGAEEGDEQQGESGVWESGEGLGQINGVPFTDRAVVSVRGLLSDGAGSPNQEAVVAATTVGLVDISGADGEVELELDVFLGRVGEFHQTSTLDGTRVVCSRGVEERWGHTATRLQDGRVLIVGGVRLTAGNETWWNSTEIYDPTTGAFESGPDLKWARRNHTTTLLDDGRILIAGGEYRSDADADPLTPDVIQMSQVAQIIDLEAGTSETVMMFAQRAGHTATLMGDGTVLLAGGESNAGVYLASTEIFDPARDAVTAGPNMSTGRSNHAAVRISASQVALIGGQGVTGTLKSVEFAELGLVDTTNCPVNACDLSVPRSHLAAGMVPGSNGIIAVAGGFGDSVTSPEHGRGLGTIDLIQLNVAIPKNSHRLTCLPNGPVDLTDARGAAGVTPLADGLLIMGGMSANAGQTLASAEVLRIENITANGCGVSSTRIAGDILFSPRGQPVVTPLVGDDVLITGGFSFNGADMIAVSQGEIYVRHR